MRVRPKSDAWNGWFPGLGGAKTTPSRIFVKPRTFPAAARPTSQRGERGSFPVQTDPMVCKGGDEVQNKPMIIKKPITSICNSFSPSSLSVDGLFLQIKQF